MTHRKPTQVSVVVSILILTAIGVSVTKSVAASSISFYGYQVDTPDWRSTGVPKVLTLAPSFSQTEPAPSAAYGVDGWLMPTLSSLPSYVSAYAAPGTSVLGSGYQPIDDPTVSIAPTVTDVSSGLAYQIPGAGVESTLYTFTLNNSAPTSFLVGVAFGNLPLDQTPYNSAAFRAGVGAVDSGLVTALGNNGLIDWIFFRVDGAGAGDVINIYGTGGPNGFTDLAAISFDTLVVPEPGTGSLLCLMGGLFLCRIRRSTASSR